MIGQTSWLGLVFALLLMGKGVLGAEVTEVQIPRMEKPPVIDGAIHPEEWQFAARMEGLAGQTAEAPELLAPHQASYWVGTDGHALYIAMSSATPPEGKLLSRVVPTPKGRNPRVQLDDAVEIAIAPRADGVIYRLLINARGAIATIRRESNGGEAYWESEATSRSQVEDDRWHLEACIPLEPLGLTAEALRSGIGLSIGRHWKRARYTQAATYWSNSVPDTPGKMPRVTLSPTAPAVQVLQLIDPKTQNVSIGLSFFNPHPQRIDLQAVATLTPGQSAPASFSKPLTLKPRETRTLEFRLSGAHDPGETVAVDLHVQTFRRESLYTRRFSVRCDVPEEHLWTLDNHVASRVNVRFAYFPSYDEMKLSINFQALHQKESVREVVCTLLNAKGSPLAETALPVADGEATLARWKLPKLPEGEYRLQTRLVGASEIPVIEHSFVRHQFPWEGNELGRSESLVPPFTPLKIDGEQVHAILRDHRLGSAGLWEQVISDGQPILAGPMQLQGRKAGAVLYPEAEKKWTVEKAMDTRITTRHAFRIGGLSATAATHWEQDGMMSWELELPANPKGALDGLTLVIPIRSEIATLFHACTDGLRFNRAGALPERDGLLWDSTQAPRNAMAHDYVAYIWIGGASRGLSIFGENDRGWIARGDTPMQEIVRRNGQVELHCHLIAGPAKWDKPRTIRLGLQATPTKPMPKGWRTTFMGGMPPKDILEKYGDRLRHITFIGSTGSYGSASQAMEPAPRKDDFSIWETLARVRATGESEPGLIARWKEESTGIYAKSNSPSELNYGMHLVSHQPKEVLVYTNARGVRLDTPQGQTFLDEWILTEFSKREVAPLAGVHYTVDPVRSYQDWMMWLYQKLFSTFADHIYWDDIFLSGNFDLATSDAYLLKDGRIAPASGLTNMRELIKRTAVLGVEMGKEPFNMVHMTNTAIAPILSFSQMLYSWEDKMGVDDFQDRWPMDYIRAETIGRQHGNIPVVMNLIRSKDGKPVPEETLAWVYRTAAAVMISHELRPNQHRLEYWDALRPLLEFGYGLPEVTARNYWEKDYPIHLSGGPASSLLLTRGKEALLFICDYAEGGERTIRIEPRLGRLISAVNVESHQPVTVHDQSLQFSMRKHDYATFRLVFEKDDL